MHTLKHLFLGMALLSVVESTTATEILPKEDFESAINEGLSDFMDQFGMEKKAELGIEDLVEKQRLKEDRKERFEQEAAEAQRVSEEAEKQRMKQEAEHKEKQELMALWGYEIDKIIECIQYFQYNAFEDTQLWYNISSKHEKITTLTNTLSILQTDPIEQIAVQRRLLTADMVKDWPSRCEYFKQGLTIHQRIGYHNQQVYTEWATPIHRLDEQRTKRKEAMITLAKTAMLAYKNISGFSHSHWDELSKM